jgi:hypothetical protein
MRKVLVFSIAAIFVSTAAANIIDDDFESYADTAALDAFWPVTTGTNADTFLSVDPLDPLNQCVAYTTVAARRSQSFTPFTAPLIVWGYDFYDTVGTAAMPRQYGQLLADNGGLSELIAMGQYNAAPSVPDFYQARVAFSGVGWFNLTTPRSVGWHRFEAHIGPTTVDFYVDGLLDTAAVPHNGGMWYEARIGSGLSSTGTAFYDNYLLTPEPGTLTLLALGGFALLRRR